MPFKTVAEVVAEFQRSFPDCDTTSAQNYLLNALQEVGRDLNLYRDSASLRLNQNSATYSLVSSAAAPWYVLGTSTTKATATATQFFDVYYVESSTSRFKLDPTSPEELTMLDPDWRYADAGTPKYYYLTATSAGALSFGLYPKPDTSSSPSDGSGYPRVDVYYRTVLSSLPSELPDVLRNDDSILHHMLSRYALAIGDARQPYFEQQFRASRGRALKTINGNQRDNPPRFLARRSFPVV